MTSSYDALLLLSFGGPEGPDDVIPFLENVTRGRDIPRERLEAVGEHYHLFGGVSPINQLCRDLKGAIEADFAAHGLDLPVYWGNRNWTPYLADTVRQMKADGVRRAAAFVTSAYSGYSTNDQYLADIERAREEVEGAPVIDKLPVYSDRPGFIAPFVDAAKDALSRLPAGARLVFTAHSVPLSQPNRELYVAELEAASRTVAEKASPGTPWDLVYQSRSGPPAQPWLEPQITDHLEKLHGEGVRAVAVVPIGFVSDHMEVKYDLDVEAAGRAGELGVAFVRAATPGADPRFAALPRHLLDETR
ncbi:ferrochelatase [Actinomadura chibensis]|uniref:Coproporphyrin III ferrochelatase n=1 Tax=Actinomadura chibensis TaxID=392828 RepID=A0A5D0NFS1_9ACTN|nr:ferrochelatase [Actinomadura chibensis]TYB43041.1 ferrochelatase [Actinomadura chibensis]